MARRLEKHLARSDVVLLHDRRIPRTSANIDHVAIGPGGVTVIDTENVSGNDRSTLIDLLAWQVQAVRDTLDDLGFPHISVAGALCFADGSGLPFFRRQETHGLLVDGPRRVAALARRPGPLGHDVITQVRDELADALSAP